MIPHIYDACLLERNKNLTGDTREYHFDRPDDSMKLRVTFENDDYWTKEEVLDFNKGFIKSLLLTDFGPFVNADIKFVSEE